MARGDFADETPQRVVNIAQRLRRFGLGIENHKVDRVTLMQRHANLGVPLEPADAGSVPGARVHDDDRRLVGIDTVVPAVVPNLGNAQQRVVRRLIEAPRIQDRLVFEVEQRRQAGALVPDHVICALAQYVEKQDAALPGIDSVGPDVIARRRRRFAAVYRRFRGPRGGAFRGGFRLGAAVLALRARGPTGCRRRHLASLPAPRSAL